MKKKTLTAQSISTPLFQVGQDLGLFIVEVLSKYSIKEKSVLAISSKLFSLAENKIVQTKNKADLIKKEADQYLGTGGHDFHLTIKEGILLPSSGIDQSNSPTGDYILFPKNPYLSLETLWNDLRLRWSLKKFGLLMTDSHTTPLRRGVTGVALAHWGFKAVRDLRGTMDLYKRVLKVTTVNNVDALAACAVWLMGEGDEGCPLVLIEDIDLEWEERSCRKDIRISVEEDLYRPLYEKRINERGRR